MSSQFDVVIRGGTIVDGTGAQPYVADVGVKDGVIAEIGRIEASAPEEIDARGLTVTPGFVDVHTHYDGQITWENRMAPSSNHASPPSSWAIAASASRRCGTAIIN
ncbi:amidohydrolase family protein [Sphingobium fuliginis]|uniref:amidohydrolase family protein n=1 Tax=Sphingobium fuliginis (strain ATCC 27551) TaxID=336203 RepID=UPI0003F90403